MSYLQCPECRLTVPAAAYYLRGDECPRCLTTMESLQAFRRERDRSAAAAPLPHATAPAQQPEAVAAD